MKKTTSNVPTMLATPVSVAPGSSDDALAAAEAAPKPFTDHEFMTLVRAIHLRPGPHCSDEEFTRYMEWALRVRSEGLLLERLLREEVLVIGFDGDEPQFGTQADDGADATVVRAEHSFGVGEA